MTITLNGYLARKNRYPEPHGYVKDFKVGPYLKISLRDVYLDKEYIGKTLRFKIEVVDDEED